MLQTENRGGTLAAALNKRLIEDWNNQTTDRGLQNTHQEHREGGQGEDWPVRLQIL